MKRRTAPTTNTNESSDQLTNTLKSKLLVTAVALLLAIACAKGAAAERTTDAGREKLAEIAAMARHNERCPDIPRQWAAAYLTLLMPTPPGEEQVLAEERKTLALRREIGIVKWCQLYSVEMEQAYLIYQYIVRR